MSFKYLTSSFSKSKYFFILLEKIKSLSSGSTESKPIRNLAFTLEDNIRYLKEFRLGDKIYPSFLLTNANEKMLHFVGILLNENDELAAIFETVLGHINLNERKMTPFSDDRLKNIIAYKNESKLDQDLPFELKLRIRDL